MWCLCDEKGNILFKTKTKAAMVYGRYSVTEKLGKGAYRVEHLLSKPADEFPVRGTLYGSEEKARIYGCHEQGEVPKAQEKGISLGTISVDVELLSDGSYDVWISTEGSSGAHYRGISPSDVGSNVADLIECIAENYQ